MPGWMHADGATVDVQAPSQLGADDLRPRREGAHRVMLHLAPPNLVAAEGVERILVLAAEAGAEGRSSTPAQPCRRRRRRANPCPCRRGRRRGAKLYPGATLGTVD